MAIFKKSKKDISLLSGNKKERAAALLNKVEFMETELLKLQKTLAEKGWIEEYQNGPTQTGLKKSTEADIYNTLTKNYLSAMKQLDDMIGSIKDSDGFDEF